MPWPSAVSAWHEIHGLFVNNVYVWLTFRTAICCGVCTNTWSSVGRQWQSHCVHNLLLLDIVMTLTTTSPSSSHHTGNSKHSPPTIYFSTACTLLQGDGIKMSHCSELSFTQVYQNVWVTLCWQTLCWRGGHFSILRNSREETWFIWNWQTKWSGLDWTEKMKWKKYIFWPEGPLDTSMVST